MNKLYLAIAFISICFSANAQNVLADGNKNFAEGKYFEAATCYEKVLGINKPTMDKVSGYTPYGHKKMTNSKTPVINTPYSREEVIYKLAESYRLYSNFEQAEKWYKKSVDSSKLNLPLKKFWYAVCLRSNKKYKEAETQFNQFISSYSPDDFYKKSAIKEFAILNNIPKLTSKKDSVLYKVKKLDTTRINVEGANYAPSWFNDKLLFTSSRVDSIDLAGLGKKHPIVRNNVYEVNAKNGITQDPVRVKFTNDTFMVNKGATTITPNGKKMFFTIWKQVGDKKVHTIYESSLVNNTWTEPKKLGKTVNVDGFSSKQPFVTSDGKYLLFSSNRPGGVGGFDLWYAELGRDYYVLDAYNLGDVVNTFADEQSPFYHNTTNNLVFSSNGRIGMGGFDLYKSKGQIKSSWSEPTNLGYPVNSPKDEIDFLGREGLPLLENSYFSSDKGDVCCPQIYSLNKEIVAKTFVGRVFDSTTNQPLANSLVVVTDSITGKELFAVKTNDDGQYAIKLKQLPSLNLNVSKDNYYSNQANYTKMDNLEELEAESFTLPNISISKIVPIVKKITPPDIIVYFDFDKYDVTPIGKLQLDSMVDRLKKDSSLVIEIQGNTDSKGSEEYNKKLGLKRAVTCYDYFIKAGVVKTKLSVVSNGMDKAADKNTLEDGTDNEAGRQHNRRVEFRIIKN